MFIYEATIAQKHGDHTWCFPTLKEARAFIKENDIGGSYWIKKIDVGTLTSRLLCDVINSQGGSYVEDSSYVEERYASLDE